MADMGDNYKREMGEDENGEPVEIGRLGPECGRHCGVITVGASTPHEAHCDCNLCHGHTVSEISSRFTSQQNGVDPRGIR